MALTFNSIAKYVKGVQKENVQHQSSVINWKYTMVIENIWIQEDKVKDIQLIDTSRRIASTFKRIADSETMRISDYRHWEP
jgi:hypothetical protein